MCREKWTSFNEPLMVLAAALLLLTAPLAGLLLLALEQGPPPRERENQGRTAGKDSLSFFSLLKGFLYGALVSSSLVCAAWGAQSQLPFLPLPQEFVLEVC